MAYDKRKPAGNRTASPGAAGGSAYRGVYYPLEFSGSCHLKKSGKWRLLRDLRAIKKIIQPMSSLQPGIPLPSLLPKEWLIIVINLKTTFSQFLYMNVIRKFAFSVPTFNRLCSVKRYHWNILSQDK